MDVVVCPFLQNSVTFSSAVSGEKTVVVLCLSLSFGLGIHLVAGKRGTRALDEEVAALVDGAVSAAALFPA